MKSRQNQLTIIHKYLKKHKFSKKAIRQFRCEGLAQQGGGSRGDRLPIKSISVHSHWNLRDVRTPKSTDRDHNQAELLKFFVIPPL